MVSCFFPQAVKVNAAAITEAATNIILFRFIICSFLYAKIKSGFQ